MRLVITFLGYLLGIFSPLAADPPPSNVYYPRPTSPVSEYVRIQIVVEDDFDPDGGIMQNVVFNKETLPLHATNYSGERGSFYFQVVPGTYTLRWTVTYGNRVPATQEYVRTIDATTPKRLIHISLKNEDSFIE